MAVTRENRKGRYGKKVRWYSTPDGAFPSVTTVLDCVNVGGSLGSWAGGLERAAVVETAGRLYERLSASSPIPESMFTSTLLSELPGELEGDREFREAGEIGTQAHSLCELWNEAAKADRPLDIVPQLDKRANWAYDLYALWAKSVDLKPISIETFVWSKSHAFAGSLDLRAYINGKDTLVDLKTSNSIRRTALLQVAAYAYADAEMGHGMPEQCMIVRLPKKIGDTKIQVKVIEDVAGEFKAFLCALALWRALNPQEES